MDTDTGGNPRSYDLCVRRQGFQIKAAAARIVLDDTGIVAEREGETRRWPYGDLSAIRIQAVMGAKNSPWESAVHLRFSNGEEISVLSTSPWGNNEPSRDPVYIAFVEDLHRRLSPEDIARIAFRRGVSDGAHHVQMFAAGAAIVLFGGAALLIMSHVPADDAGHVLQVLLALASLAGFGWWIWTMIQKGRPGSYDPRDLPRDLFPQ